VLVSRARGGDASALDDLIRRHHGLAYRVALGIVRDSDLAQDVVQDAFVKAMRALKTFRGDAPFKSWMMTIVSNQARTALRSQGRRQESGLDVVAPIATKETSVDDGVVHRSEAERAREFIARLPDKQRLAVMLRIDEGLSFREVAEATGSTEGSARVNYHHGITKLRTWMTEERV